MQSEINNDEEIERNNRKDETSDYLNKRDDFKSTIEIEDENSKRLIGAK